MKNTIIFRVLASSALLLSAASAFAQTAFIKVLDLNQNPAKHVTVKIGTAFSLQTDTLGKLEMSLLDFDIANLTLWGVEGQLNYEILDSTFRPAAGTLSYTLQIIPLQIEAAIISATRAGGHDPFTTTEIQKKELEVQNTGRDLPVLLQYSPGVITTSDAGNGVGYTSIRVRGSDASRTNITVNGVPINDAESQGTFWVNMPDLTSSVQSIQIQRGAGSSTMGSGAFGANVNIQTAASFQPYGLISQSYGSFQTNKTTIAAGSGLLHNHWTVDLRLSQIHSNGYVDRAASDLKSYFISAGYVGNKWSVKYLHFSGTEHTYQAWYGVPREKLMGPDSALRNQYSRNVGFIYQTSSDSVNLFSSNNRTYNFYQYKNETDNYTQGHHHLYVNCVLNAANQFNLTLYHTAGAGYFEQHRPNDSLKIYGIPDAIFGTDTLKTSEIIRQRWLDNTLTGFNANWMHQGNKWNFTFGGGYSQYLGNHYGQIIWARTAPAANYQAHYYDAIGDKYDGNIFLKTQYILSKGTWLYGDFQLRRVYHTGRGLDNDLRPIKFAGDYLFYNQKLGITKTLSKVSNVYGSVSLLNKEPSRTDFTDRPLGSIPKPESMMDVELGWKMRKRRVAAEATAYWMKYHNQLVLTGAVNDVGTPLRTNVDRSYRAGLEVSAAYRINPRWQVSGNLALSQNRIDKMVLETLDYADYSVVKDTVKNVPIAYSPNVVGAFVISWTPKKSWLITWNHKWVGKQYLDNSGNNDKVLNAYYFSEIWINKSVKLEHSTIEFKFQILNVFNNLYSNNGYAYEYYYGKGSLTREVYLFPSATRNVMGSITLKF